MCGGAAREEKDLAKIQNQFTQQLMANYSTQFGASSAILKSLTDALQPILSKGIGQQGFTPEELAAMRTQVTEGTAKEYSKAVQAVQGNIATRGGGNEVIPSGADEQLRGEVASAGAADQASALNRITQANYAQGRQNYLYAAEGLGKVAAGYDPTGYLSAANQAGQNAFQSANTVGSLERARLAGIISTASGAATAALGAATGGGGGGA